MKNTLTLLLGTAVILGLLFSLASAESDIKEGYDENTEITVSGTILEITHHMRGPVIVRLSSRGRVYNIKTAPLWYLAKENITFVTGAQIEVMGSKYVGTDGNLYLMARQIKDPATGQTFVMRDSACRPLWWGDRRGGGPQGTP